jgi:hypothetical protein
VSELRRWSEEGATTHELSLLEVSRRERAPAQARARTLKALGIGAATSTAASTAMAASKGGLGALGKLTALALLGGGLVGGGLVVRGVQQRRSMLDGRTPASLAIVVPRIASAAVTAVPEEPAPPAAPVASASSPAPPVLVSSAPRPIHAAAVDGKLLQEMMALKLAHEALAAHDPGTALRQLDRYRVQFPGGGLASEATVLRVQALLASGNRGGAQGLADAYSRSHPDSPYAHRIEDLLHRGR